MEQGYAVFLLLGVVLVLIDGQLIYRGGKGYMSRAYGDPEAARSMTRLATVLFHLVVLGLLAIVSVVSVNTGDPVKDVVVKLGVMFLILALVHAVTMLILGRIRDRQLQQQLADEMAEEHRQYEQQRAVPPQTRVEPAPAERPRAPRAEDLVDPTQVKTTR
jgi:ABC-type multidrug transport system fused ATPase/permease subunit